ncbi:unnamed protein product, partial [marine sediment metagenome]
TEGTWYTELNLDGAISGNSRITVYSTGTATQRVFYGSTFLERASTRGNVEAQAAENSLDSAGLKKLGAVYHGGEGNLICNVNGEYGTETAGFTTYTTGPEISLFLAPMFESMQMRELQRYDITSFAEGKTIIDKLMLTTLDMTAGTSGPKQGYETAVMGTLDPDNPFGFTINELSEQSNDITLVVEGIVSQDIFETIELDGVTLTMLAADTFVTGSGISTWTFDSTTINLVNGNPYDVLIQVMQA